MSITIELSPEATVRLKARAALLQLSVDDYIKGLLDQDSAETVLSKSVRTLQERTPEERLLMRNRILAASRLARPLPPGKTLEDVVVGTWPGHESESEVTRALDELS